LQNDSRANVVRRFLVSRTGNCVLALVHFENFSGISHSFPVTVQLGKNTFSIEFAATQIISITFFRFVKM